MALKNLNLAESDLHDNFVKALERKSDADEKQKKKLTKNKETSKQGRKLPGKQTRLSANKQANNEPSPQTNKNQKLININPDLPHRQRMYRKQTFEFSQADLDFMDLIKFELRASSVTKNAIVRTGLEALRKDYQANKETSFLVRKFAGK